MRRLSFVLAFVFVTLSPCSAAESASQVMMAFGLFGAWSVNCSIPESGRVTFAEHYFGNPTLTILSKNASGADVKIDGDVITATRVTEEKLTLSLLYTHLNGTKIEPPPSPAPLLVEKMGTKMIIDMKPSEKCLN